MKRGMMMLLLVLGLRMPAEAAGTRLASVYLESINALQAQVFQAAQVFEAPELGSAPMMMGMLIPGFAQLDRDAAIGLHIYAGGEQHVGFVMALKPAVAPELFLGGLLARQGLSVPEPVDGRYSTSNGVAQMQGDLLLIARNAADLDLAMEAGLPVALPDIPGFLRLDLAPGRLADLIGELEGLALKAMADAPAQADAMRQGFDLYRRGLAQVAKVQHGISVTGEGLVFRSRLMPQPGRALEGILASLQPADPQWVAALEGDHMFGVVAGAYKVPEDVMRTGGLSGLDGGHDGRSTGVCMGYRFHALDVCAFPGHRGGPDLFLWWVGDQWDLPDAWGHADGRGGGLSRADGSTHDNGSLSKTDGVLGYEGVRAGHTGGGGTDCVSLGYRAG